MKTYPYLVSLLLLAALINENAVQWALAVNVGGYSLAAGCHNAFTYFSLLGYLFFTAFRLVPYLVLGGVLVALSKTRFKDYIPAVFAGGLAGILAMIIWGSWVTLRPLYTGAHVSSTTAIAFLFIPIYAIPAGAIGALLFAALYTPLRNLFRTHSPMTNDQ